MWGTCCAIAQPLTVMQRNFPNPLMCTYALLHSPTDAGNRINLILG